MDEKYRVVIKNLTPTQKMRALSGLMHTAREMQKAGIRMRNPGISEVELNRRVRDAMLYAKH